MDLEQWYETHAVTPERVLELVDEYSLYCKVLGFEPVPGRAYKSMVRLEGDRDTFPSFCFFHSKKRDREFMWKDQAKGLAGDIFKLICMTYQGINTVKDACMWVIQEYQLPLGNGQVAVHVEKITTHEAPEDTGPAIIRVKRRIWDPKDVKWWKSFGIGANQIRRHFVSPLDCFWINSATPTTVKDPVYDYPQDGYHKLYRPLSSKGNKFRNNYPDHMIEGFQQLQYKYKTLVITKARKDIMTLEGLHELKIEAVAPKGEGILIPYPYLRFFEKKYDRILVLFDNDGKHKADSYPYEKIFIPQDEFGTKDPSDHYRRYGRRNTLDLLDSLIYE